MKVALCTIAKLENRYIREWVSYHLAIGFDHIFIYDNNDPGGEHLEDALPDLTNVTIVDVRGIKKKNDMTVQYFAYTDCYKSYGNSYDYMFFTDVDAFVVLEDKNGNVKQILNNTTYAGFDQIRLFLRTVRDNDLVTVDDNNYNVLSRFIGDYRDTIHGSSFLRTGNPDIMFVGPHGSPNAKRSCDVLGNEVDHTKYSSFSVVSKNPIYKVMWVNHYYTKTIEEYLNQKLDRGYPDGSRDLPCIEKFFRINERTPEKILFIKKWFSDHNREINGLEL